MLTLIEVFKKKNLLNIDFIVLFIQLSSGLNYYQFPLNKMIRILISVILTSFLFIGILSTANLLLGSKNESEVKLIAQTFENNLERSSIREIETITADNNYSFTSKNALR